MPVLSNSLLDSLLCATVTRQMNYYIPAGQISLLMYYTGCRREEATTFTRWGVHDVNTIYLDPLKGNSRRYFTLDQVPTWWFNGVQSGIEPYPGFTKFKVDYYIQMWQLQTMWLIDKRIESHAFRHNYARKLYAQGKTFEEIRIIMGESSVAVVQDYINTNINVNSNMFTNITFESSQAQFQSLSLGSSFNSNGSVYCLINYGDYSFCDYIDASQPGTYQFPDHVFNSGYGSGIDKSINIYFSNQLAVSDLSFVSNDFKGTFPASFQNFTGLESFTIDSQLFTNVSNMYNSSLGLVSYTLIQYLDSAAITANKLIPSQLLTSQYHNVMIADSKLRSNTSSNNVSLIANLINCLILDLRYLRTNINVVNFNNLIELREFYSYENFQPSGTISATIANCINLTKLFIDNNQLDHFTNIESLISLQNLTITKNTSISDIFPANFSALTQLSILNFGSSYRTLTRINNFVDSFYTFITTNASMTIGSTPFRNMTVNIGDSNDPPSGTFQQPSGYVQGSSNGSPASQKEKLWVLVNQYNHTIDFN